MLEKQSYNGTDSRLDIQVILADLEREGLLSHDKAKLMRSIIRPEDTANKSAIELLSEKNLPNLKLPDKVLTLEFLCEWLSKKISIPYYHIDPLKVDVASTTQVMSYAYAERYCVLPVKVTDTQIHIATIEPFVRHWSQEIARIANKEIVFVIGNPKDIRRYQIEFYNLSKSVKGAKDRHAEGSNPIQNLEQLMQLGRSGNLDANDQHVISIVDWLLQYAFEQRASDIHMEPRRITG